MADAWDFSSFLEKWAPGSLASEENVTTDEIEQIKSEIEQINQQLESLEPAGSDNSSLLVLPSHIQARATQNGAIEEQQPADVEQKRPQTKQISNLSKQITVSRKPKIITPRTAARNAMTVSKPEPQPTKVFLATPSELKVVNFSLDMEYILKFTIQNIYSKSSPFRLIPPSDPSFLILTNPDATTSTVRPGLSTTIAVSFSPTEPRDYEGSIVIYSFPNFPPTIVTLRCFRDPPQLVLPDVVDLGATLVHSVKQGTFEITNVGGTATFSLVSPASAFTISPDTFMLDHNETLTLSVTFRPSQPGTHSSSFEITSLHFPQKFYFLTRGDSVTPSLAFTITPEKSLFLPFLPFESNTTRTVQIQNEADVGYPFYIQTVRPKDSVSKLLDLFPEYQMEISKETPFSVFPSSGFIGPREAITLQITFSPKDFALYRANLAIFASRVPTDNGSQVSHKMLTIFTEGCTGPRQVTLVPPFTTSINQPVEIINSSYLPVQVGSTTVPPQSTVTYTDCDVVKSGRLALPILQFEPPILDFGAILAGSVQGKKVRLVNRTSTGIDFTAGFEDGICSPPEGNIRPGGFMEIEVTLNSSSQKALRTSIEIASVWSANTGSDTKQNEPMDSHMKIISAAPSQFLGTYIRHLPVTAVFDRPLIQIRDRIIDIGDAYPTVEYSANIHLTLLNSFPAEAKVNGKAVSLKQGVEQAVNVTVKFDTIGRNAMPVIITTLGGVFSAAIIANVKPPAVNLHTREVDFSKDFVICRESKETISIRNECHVPSHVELIMDDDAGGVFKMDGQGTRDILPFSEVNFEVRCYSEIHGDYSGRVYMRISDDWQDVKIPIPLHVKALGSFFGFRTHTLGFGNGGVSFGETHPDQKVIRRVALENFSSEGIKVEWTLQNYVEGRIYANLALDISDDGAVDVHIRETEDSRLQTPFRIVECKGLVESHGQIVTVVEFIANKPGSYRGCLAARSGEFVHALDLTAKVTG